MPDFHLNCVNCGKQNLILADDPWNVKCEFCGLPIRIKQINKVPTSKPLVTNSDEPAAAVAKAAALTALPPTPAPLTPAPLKAAAPISPPPLHQKHLSKRIKHMRHLRFHKEEIIKDYDEMTWEALIAKWHMHNNTATKLLKEWGVTRKGRGRRVAKKTTEAATPTTPPAAAPFKFPPIPNPMPPFNEAWPLEVKIGYFHAKAIIAIEEIIKIITNSPREKKDAKKS